MLTLNILSLIFGMHSAHIQVVLILLILFHGVLLFALIPPFIRLRHFDEVIRRYIKDEHQIHHLREHLALAHIIKIVFWYWFFVQLGAFAIFAIYLTRDNEANAFLRMRNVHPVWFACFHAISSFNNAGFVILSDNLIGFAEDRLVLLMTSVEILLGNVMAPVMLRLIVTILHRTFPDDEGYSLLLHHPRAVFTHMFGPEVTIMLSAWILIFTVSEIAVFLGTDWNEPFLSSFSSSTKVLIAYFQAIATRTAGFNTVAVFSVSQTRVSATFLLSNCLIFVG